jgi:hypothetical protein
MKNALFVVCFSLGVTLMIFSGYMPSAASARGSRAGFGSDPDNMAVVLAASDFSGTVTRKAPPIEPPPYTPDTESPAATPDVPAQLAEEVAGETESPAQPGVPADAAPAIETPPALAEAARAMVVDALPLSVVPETPAETTLVADAGADRVAWGGWDEIVLDGRRSVGERLTYQWRQTAGPVWLNIADDLAPVTSATGFVGDDPPSWRNRKYQFELIVTDARGQEATDTVQYLVKTAPTMRIKPAADRHFEFRDGYWLGHFTSWATNLESYETVFEITADRELRFTKVTGSPCELTGGKNEAGTGYHYQVVVYGQAGEPTSWVEFLADTDERIPGIVQLGVNWEAR